LRAEAEFRERFIGILAHDLRQPLNTLLMAIQVLSQAPGGADVAARGQRAARRMHRMVEELLDFTRSRVGGGMPISPVQADLAEIVRRVVSDRSEKDLVSFETLGDTRGSWDADRIAQVCSNLIGNAIEHGAPHRPIRVRLVGLPNGITLDVHNEGPAIAADALATLFDPFRGVSQRAPRSGHPGLGLGLYIVDQIVRAHGGSMDVETGDDGTTFRVHLPGHAMHPTTAAERKT
jgi:signal transduction histidine kinase